MKVSPFLLVTLIGGTVAQSSSLCLPDCSSGSCIFDVNVHLTAGHLGYFEVVGCDGVNPTLGIEIGVTHTFLQHQYENYYHPLGFAYYADGAHDDAEELEPGIPPPGSGSDCGSTMTCPAPMYFLNGEYLGVYSNDPDVLPVTTNETDFGLDHYEPVFFYPFTQWVEFGEWSINLRFDTFYDKDIFYFCHIHQYMSGRIKLLKDGEPTQPDADLPEIPYPYDMPSEYDQTCGSTGMEDFQLPHPQCPLRFICGEDDSFAGCIETQNCYMFAGMTTGASARSVVALFLHQMIPHHENAINMAKTLLQEGGLGCDTFDDSPDCVMYSIALEIISDQNFQVQAMQGLLDAYGYNLTDDCVVPVSTRNFTHRLLISEDTSEVTHISSVKELKVEKHDVPRHMRGSRTAGRLLGDSDSRICVSSTGTYTVRVNIYAGQLGYYTFDECGDEINPTIGLEIGETYLFEQYDRSNYYHPMGIAYYPDGAHAQLDELQPGIPPYGSDSDCADDLTCPAPMYFKDGVNIGNYSNIAEILPVSTDVDDYGLEGYKPLFVRPSGEWSASNFSFYMKFDVEDFGQDLFYFSHILQFMSGRIKLLKGGAVINEEDDPELPYSYDVPGEFDAKCGSYGLDAFQLPNEQCFEPFVCDVPSGDSHLELYAECIEAMNCHMLAGMTTKATTMSRIGLFIYHMIPHHENAINMAKSTLALGKYQCDDLTDEEASDCILERILREIVNSQNIQIQSMYGVLEAQGLPETNDCIVTFNVPFPSDDDSEPPTDDSVSADDDSTDDHSGSDGPDNDDDDHHSDDDGSDDDNHSDDDGSDDDGSDDDHHSDDDGSDDDDHQSDDDGSDDDDHHSDDDGSDDDDHHSDDDGSDDDNQSDDEASSDDNSDDERRQ